MLPAKARRLLRCPARHFRVLAVVPGPKRQGVVAQLFCRQLADNMQKRFEIGKRLVVEQLQQRLPSVVPFGVINFKLDGLRKRAQHAAPVLRRMLQRVVNLIVSGDGDSECGFKKR